MRRLLALTLGWCVAFAPAASAAALVVEAPLGAAPVVSAPATLGAAALGLSAPSLAPAFAAPTLSIAPSAIAPVAFAPVALAPAAALPVAAFSAALPAAAAPAPAASYAAPEPARAARALDAAPSPTASVLARFAAAPDAAALRFDGARAAASADETAAPTPATRVDAPALAPASPRPAAERPGFWRRLNQATRPGSHAETVFERWLGLGLLAAVTAPFLWHAAPIHTLQIDVPVALVLPTLAAGALTVSRIARFLFKGELAPSRPSGRRAAALAAALGLALGLGAGTAPSVLRPAIVQAGTPFLAPAEHIQAIPGDAIAREIVADFSTNPVGRRVLDGLRDRAGRVRLPDFYLSDQNESVAEYRNVPNGVFLSKSEIKSSGWTAARFLADPDLQRRYIRANLPLFAHELTHADQARRSPLEPGQFSQGVEYEYEAYLNEHLYTHEMLKADPTRNDLGSELGSYMIWLDDLDAAVREVDGSYPDDVHVRSPRIAAVLARARLDWPAHRVEGYMLLSRRFARSPKMARSYVEQARRVAAENGLPRP
jgi:hypothetical protein